MSNDDQFEHISVLKQDFEFEPEPIVHIVGNSDDITVDSTSEDEVAENPMENIDCYDVPGVVEQIQQMDFDDAVKSLKVFIAQIICQAQEVAYDEISKFTSKKSAIKSIEREKIDELAMESDE